MADPNQAQLAALLALLASQQGKTAPAPAPVPNVLSIPPPSASGSLDLSNLAKPTSSGSGLFQPPAPRYGDDYSDRKYPRDDEYYRHRDRDDRYPPSRGSGYDDGHRFGRGDSRDWERDRDRDSHRERDRDYDRRDNRRPGRYRERSISPAPRRPYSPPEKDYEDQMPIDTIHVGMVIGRGGETLRRIERDSGARVQFAPESQSRPGVRVANLFGTVSQVNSARAAINVLVANNIANRGSGNRRDGHGAGGGSSGRGKEPAMAPGTNKLTFTVPDKCVGLIIGRGGESINEIQRRSGARVNIVPESQSVNGRRPVNLFGSDDANEKARELIEVIVRQDELGVKKGQENSAGASQRSDTYDQSAAPARTGGSFDMPSSYSEAPPYQAQQQATPSQFGTYQNPFQYFQSGTDTAPPVSDPAAWAAYYAQQQQQQQQQQQSPSSGYPQYSEGGS